MFLQSVNHTYNVHGWLKAINSSSLSASTDANAADDLLGMAIEYTTGGITVNAEPISPCHDGKLPAVSWKNSNLDRTDREHIYGYGDQNGNLATIKRIAEKGGVPKSPPMDCAPSPYYNWPITTSK